MRSSTKRPDSYSPRPPSEIPPWEQYPPRFKPFEHECRQVTVLDSVALKLLSHVAPYEAQHIACLGGNLTLRCPNCGGEVEPFLNPFISSLIDGFPHETVGWNPWHKGFVLCRSCERYLANEWALSPNGWVKRYSTEVLP
jgi:hypothetical protein